MSAELVSNELCFSFGGRAALRMIMLSSHFEFTLCQFTTKSSLKLDLEPHTHFQKRTHWFEGEERKMILDNLRYNRSMTCEGQPCLF